MNYLGHMLMANEHGRSFRFGAVLPDLAGMNGLTPAKCSPADIKNKRDRHARRLLAGISFHHLTDVVFDGLDGLLELKDILYSQIAPEHIPPDSHYAILIAGAGTDLMIDGEVQRFWPDINGLYRMTMHQVPYPIVAASVRNTPQSSKINFFRNIKERAALPVPNYSDPKLVARILAARVNGGGYKHIRIAEQDVPQIEAAMEAYQPHIRAYGFGLIRATAEALGVQLPKASQPTT